MTRRIACIWLPNWPCQRWLHHHPQCVGHPFALQQRDPRRGWRIAAASSIARQQGILPGMSTSQALSLGIATLPTTKPSHPTPKSLQPNSTAPPNNLLLGQLDPDADREALEELAQAAQQFSPTVALESLEEKPWAIRSLHQPQALLMEATHLGRWFGSEQEMARQILHWLQSQQLVARIAIADSLAAAWAIAQGMPIAPLAQALLRQNQIGIASWLDIPGETPPWIADSYSLPQWLDRLPVTALRIDQPTAHTLRRLGISRLHQLLQLPRSGLAQRLGPGIIRKIDQILGQIDESITGITPSQDWSACQPLEIPIDRIDWIEQILAQLLEQICQRLQERSEGGLRWIARLTMQEGPDLLWTLNLFRPSADPNYLRPLLLQQCEAKWKSIATNSPPAIIQVHLQAALRTPVRWHQTLFFDQDTTPQQENIAPLLDRLSNRLGRQAVVQGILQTDPLPEQACRWNPITGTLRTYSKRSSSHSQSIQTKGTKPLPAANYQTRWRAEPQETQPLRRPTQLLPMPLPLTTSPPACQDLPRTFQLGHQPSRKVLQARGPERIETGWWEGDSIQRDYYRIELDHGDWWWVYLNRRNHTWYLHGYFG